MLYLIKNLICFPIDYDWPIQLLNIRIWTLFMDIFPWLVKQLSPSTNIDGLMQFLFNIFLCESIQMRLIRWLQLSDLITCQLANLYLRIGDRQLYWLFWRLGNNQLMTVLVILKNLSDIKILMLRNETTMLYEEHLNLFISLLQLFYELFVVV